MAVSGSVAGPSQSLAREEIEAQVHAAINVLNG
jgi:hypothetical protein